MDYLKIRELYHSELAHHGIKGQRWGVRRFQNEDGTLTPAGRERYSKQFKRFADSMTFRGYRKDSFADQIDYLKDPDTGITYGFERSYNGDYSYLNNVKDKRRVPERSKEQLSKGINEAEKLSIKLQDEKLNDKFKDYIVDTLSKEDWFKKNFSKEETEELRKELRLHAVMEDINYTNGNHRGFTLWFDPGDSTPVGDHAICIEVNGDGKLLNKEVRLEG